jgi:hypothetical protein
VLKRFLLIQFIALIIGFSAHAQQSRATATSEQPTVIIRSYPNPATSVITLELNKSLDRGYSLQIYNFLGKKMFESVNINQRTTVNLTEFSRGVYIYQLRDRSGKMIESGKFQVSK